MLSPPKPFEGTYEIPQLHQDNLKSAIRALNEKLKYYENVEKEKEQTEKLQIRRKWILSKISQNKEKEDKGDEKEGKGKRLCKKKSSWEHF